MSVSRGVRTLLGGTRPRSRPAGADAALSSFRRGFEVDVGESSSNTGETHLLKLVFGL